MPTRLATTAALFALCLTALRLPAQTYGTGRYEALYGTPTEVSLYDLVQNPTSYERRAVRTRGRLDWDGRAFRIQDTFLNSALIEAMPEISGWGMEGRSWVGQEVQVTGVVFTISTSDLSERASVLIQFWQILGPEPPDKTRPEDLPLTTLEALVTRPGARDGKKVRVVGKFRGQNLFGDLPVRSRRERRDWVIKDDVFAVWVTGRKPKGSGFELDAALKRDTERWLEVVGRVETVKGVTYVKAEHVSLAAAPRPDAQAQAPPPPSPRPPVPPVVVFSLPLEEAEEVPPTGKLVVQFSADMDEARFERRVMLRYAGPPRPGDRPFDALKLGYDGGRRALTVDPGDVLSPGRTLELLLLSGITSTAGLELEARPPRPGSPAVPPGAVEVLRFVVAR